MKAAHPEKVRERTGLPVLTDVHEAGQVAAVAQAVDVSRRRPSRGRPISSPPSPLRASR
jgi:endonuclease V-like protein UPF0215 family